ncbi:MAG: glycosyltransferase family 2 protein [Stomatobaculum sp.]|nr:glycosyltransferase family 2 protein [Stomatobaculum sp.]
MCSRNGEEYLREQIDSILKQTDPDVRLLISDDASTDGTQEIEKEYAERFPERVRIHFRRVPSGSAERHFFLALKQYAGTGSKEAANSGAGQYYMFADQDDVWHPDKVEKTLAAMREAEGTEEKTGAAIPIAVHCDMRVVDEEGQEIAPSYVKYQQMSPERCGLNQLLVQNNVTGGAMMMNDALVRIILSRPLPRHAVMHDHWIALAAAAFGKVIFLDEALYDYRQHGTNVLGAAKGSRVREVLDRLGLFRKDGKSKEEMDRHSASVYKNLFRQASEFGRLYGSPAGADCKGSSFGAEYKELPAGGDVVLAPEQRQMLLAFVSLQNMNRAQKIATILKYGFTFNRLHRTAGECIFL